MAHETDDEAVEAADDTAAVRHDGAPPIRTSTPVPETAARSRFSNGALIGVDRLPHADAKDAAAFSIGEFDISTIASLPMLGDDDGSVDDPAAGLVAFLDVAARLGLDGAPICWRSTGPLTLGMRAGADAPTPDTFLAAAAGQRRHLVEVADAVAAVLPASEQLVIIDEPSLATLMDQDFPIPPDHAVDLMSGAMASLAGRALVGISCPTPCDIAMMLATGPDVIGLPVDDELLEWAGYIARFLADGGVVAWGVVPTGGPIPSNAERPWRALSDLWCELVRRGCDPISLRRQSLVTPGGSLDAHAVGVARRVARITADVGRRVKDQANATRFALGA